MNYRSGYADGYTYSNQVNLEYFNYCYTCRYSLMKSVPKDDHRRGLSWLVQLAKKGARVAVHTEEGNARFPGWQPRLIRRPGPESPQPNNCIAPPRFDKLTLRGRRMDTSGSQKRQQRRRKWSIGFHSKVTTNFLFQLKDKNDYSSPRGR